MTGKTRNRWIVFLACVLGLCSLGLLVYLIVRPVVFDKDLQNFLQLARAMEDNHRRKSLGMEPRAWATPTKELFQSKTLQRLCNAIARVDLEEVDKILATNPDLNEIGVDGMTVLFFTYMEGDFPTFVKLLDKGAKPDFPIARTIRASTGHLSPQKGDTVILATVSNLYERWRFLEPALKHTDLPNQKNAYSLNALHLFFSNYPFNGREETLKPILEAGVDPMAIDYFGKTAIDYAMKNAPEFVPILENAAKLDGLK